MERLGTILIGNKKYDNLNIDNIIDSFYMNYRFNMALPNNNNGKKYDNIVLNNHIYANMKKPLEVIKKIYNDSHGIPGEHIEKFYNNIRKYKRIEPQSNNWEIFNNFLNMVGCPYIFDSLPRVGYIKMMELLLEGEKVYIYGFSFKKEKAHLYNMKTRTSKYHNHELEERILLWLHENGKIDASLCLLKDKEEIEFEDCGIKPTNKILELLSV